jgi:hypothetical protein
MVELERLFIGVRRLILSLKRKSCVKSAIGGGYPFTYAKRDSTKLGKVPMEARQ